MTNKNLTEIVAIIDKSGSMWPLCDDTIGGYNSFISEQKNAEGECYVSLYQFSTGAPIIKYESANVKNVPLLTIRDYVPGGGTALNDALGQAISNVGTRLAALDESNRPGQVIFLVITDGQENSSTEYTSDKVKEMVQHQIEKYNWRFVFLGGGDVLQQRQQAESLGFLSDNTYNYGNNAQGVSAVYAAASAGITRSRDAFLRGHHVDASVSLLSEEEIEKLKQTNE